ncbi:MAG: glycosyltransferase family 2 protein [Streptosporangiaceae bacterium]
MLSPPLVSVITPTEACRASLTRSIDSVRRQGYPRLEHVVVGDACDGDRLSRLEALAYKGSSTVPLWVANAPRAPGDVASYRPARAAHVRMVGAHVARGDLLAFLDDDNEYEPDHLMAMVQAIERRPRVRAAYCWRQLVHPDGSPYVTPASPWERDPRQAARDYHDLVAAGVWIAGTNLMRDRLERNTVDSSCWLLRKDLLVDVPFRVSYGADERRVRLGEDVAFCFDLRERAVPVRCVPRYSVRYYLGGFSTSGSGSYATSR